MSSDVTKAEGEFAGTVLFLLKLLSELVLISRKCFVGLSIYVAQIIFTL